MRSKGPDLVKVFGTRKVPTAEEGISFLDLTSSEICSDDSVGRDSSLASGNIADWLVEGHLSQR